MPENKQEHVTVSPDTDDDYDVNDPLARLRYNPEEDETNTELEPNE